MRLGWRITVSVLVTAGTFGAAWAVGAITDEVERDGAFRIDRFDQHVAISADGTTQVTEEIEVTFSQERRGIFRDLEVAPFPSDGTFTNFEVDRGHPSEPWQFAVEQGPTGPRVRIGNPAQFLTPGTYPYRITYDAPTWFYELRRDGDVAEIRIDVPGFGWPTSIGATTLSMDLPGAVRDASCVEGRRGTTRPCAVTPFTDGEHIRFEVGPFDDQESATVLVQVDRDAFVTDIPVHNPDPLFSSGGIGPWDVSRPMAAVWLALILAIPLLIWEALSSWHHYRDRMTDPALHDRQHPTALPTPPFGFRPPELAGLLLRTDADSLFLATLVDLDQRGLLTTSTETTPGGLLRKERETLTVTRPPAGTVMPPMDDEFVSALVPTGTTVFDGDYDAEVASRVTAAKRPVTERAKGVFERFGFEHDEGGIIGVGWFRALVILGYLIGAGAVAWVFTAATPLPGPASVIVVLVVLAGWGLAHLPWAHHRLPLNSTGRDARVQARAFDEFIRTVEGEQLEWAAGQPGIDHHHPAISLLPYAIVLGHADSWFDRFGSVMSELAVTSGGDGSGGVRSGQAAWWTSAAAYSSVRASQSGTSTAPSSSGGGGGGGGSGGGGGGGGSW
jgi:hypothetical protein